MGDSARPGAIALLKSNDGEEFTPWIVRVTEIQSCLNFATQFGVSLCANILALYLFISIDVLFIINLHLLHNFSIRFLENLLMTMRVTNLGSDESYKSGRYRHGYSYVYRVSQCKTKQR